MSFERMPIRRRPPLRRAGLVAIGHALGAVLGTVVVHRVLVDHGRAGVDPGSVELLRATGVTALAWAYAGLLIGLVTGLRLPAALLGYRRRAVVVHRQLNLAALALASAHLLSFALLTPGGSVLVALVPQTAPVGALGYSAGVLAFYLAIVLGPSYYLRDRIGRRAWLVAHQFAAVTYALALWHTLVLGADARVEGPARTGLWIAQIPLLALLGLRLARPLRRADDLDVERRSSRYEGVRHATLRAAVVAGIALTGFGVLYVLLAALEPGLKAG